MFDDFDAAPDAVGPHKVTLGGYQRIAASLVRAAQTGVASQAYVIAGPPGVGKRTLARLFSQALLCPAEPAGRRPCGHCRTCRLVAIGALPDLHIAAPPLHIDAARGLHAELALAPVEGTHRVAIAPEIELASPGAANSLLKTLEEPPRHAVLLLTTARPGDLLPTIRSRCHWVPLRPLPAATVAEALIAAGDADAERAWLVARLSGGRLGWARRALAEAACLSDRATWLDHLARTLLADRAGRMALAGQLAQTGAAVPEGLAVWSGWWRDVLLVHHILDGPVINRDRLADLQAAAKRYRVEDVVHSLRAIEDTLRRLATNANPLLALEVLCLELPA